MKKYLAYIIGLCVFLIIFNNCNLVPDIEENNAVADNPALSDNILDIPDGFDFSTYHDVEVIINDADAYVKYDVFIYAEDVLYKTNQTVVNDNGEEEVIDLYKNNILHNKIFSGVPENGILRQSVNLPKYCDKVYIRRNDNLHFSSEVVVIDNKQAVFNYFEPTTQSKISALNEVTDYLYGVNTSAELFQINPLDGALTLIANMPQGSHTCAIDEVNKLVYTIGSTSPNPLMEYSIENDSWQTIANIGNNGPRLGFNVADGFLYFSKDDAVTKIDPATGVVDSTLDIVGLDNISGGDLVFADDGTFYLVSFSGLYELDLDGNNDYQATRLSAESLPFSPTSITIDSDGNLWLASSGASPDLIIMDAITGGWQYIYGVSAGNNTDFSSRINDLTTFSITDENYVLTDSDGDGVYDQDDAFPNDASIAFEMYTPSKYGVGTIAFEDLWPSIGDYDFNDVALNYQTVVYLNAQNLAVKLDYISSVKSSRAGLENGVGFEIEGIVSSQIQSVSVSDQNIFNSYITFNSNGTEANQDNAVIIVTDDARLMSGETTITITFTTPVTTSALGTAPFNPFIIVNKIRTDEVHLPNKSPTTLGVISGGTANADYISSTGFPWAISFVHDFKVPKEAVAINSAYNFFNTWAISGGAQYDDWYKDGTGYRNANLIED